MANGCSATGDMVATSAAANMAMFSYAGYSYVQVYPVDHGDKTIAVYISLVILYAHGTSCLLCRKYSRLQVKVTLRAPEDLAAP